MGSGSSTAASAKENTSEATLALGKLKKDSPQKNLNYKTNQKSNSRTLNDVVSTVQSNVTMIQSFEGESSESESEADVSPLIHKADLINENKSQLRSIRHIMDSQNKQTLENASQNIVDVTRFHLTDPKWNLNRINKEDIRKQAFPSSNEELFQYKWQGMQKVGKFAWVVELLKEGSIFDETYQSKKLYVLLRMDPKHERFLLVQGFTCILGKTLGVRMPNVIIIDDSNLEDFIHIKNQIYQVAGSSVMADAEKSRILIIQEYFGNNDYLNQNQLERRLLDSSFQKSIGEIIAFDIIVNNQSHIPCIFPARGNPKNLIFTEWTGELIPIENKPVILSSPEDIAIYCSNVEIFLNQSTRRSNFEKQLLEFFKIHFKNYSLSPPFIDGVFFHFEAFLRNYTTITSEDLQRILDDITTSHPSVVAFLSTTFFMNGLKTMRKTV